MATLDRLGPPAAASAPSAAAWRPRRAIAVALAVAAAIALLQVVLSGAYTHTGAKLRGLELRRSELQAQIHQTEADVAALASLDRTERIARDRLGMVPARQQRHISVSVEGPAGALLPRPIVQPSQDEGTRAGSTSWWQALVQALPLR